MKTIMQQRGNFHRRPVMLLATGLLAGALLLDTAHAASSTFAEQATTNYNGNGVCWIRFGTPPVSSMPPWCVEPTQPWSEEPTQPPIIYCHSEVGYRANTILLLFDWGGANGFNYLFAAGNGDKPKGGKKNTGQGPLPGQQSSQPLSPVLDVPVKQLLPTDLETFRLFFENISAPAVFNNSTNANWR